MWWKTFKGLALNMPFLMFVNMQLLKKKFLRAWNMFPLNLSKHICRNVLYGLKSWGKKDKNGWRFELLHASSLENWAHESKQGKMQVTSFWYFSLFIVLNLCIPKCCFFIRNVDCASSQTKWSCFKKPFDLELRLPFIITCKLVLRSLVVCPFHSHDIYHKL
jgi:hypothetical protein